MSKPVFLCLDVSNNGIKETVENKPVFDPDFHTELIIKDEFEDLDSGNEKSRIVLLLCFKTHPSPPTPPPYTKNWVTL